MLHFLVFTCLQVLRAQQTYFPATKMSGTSYQQNILKRRAPAVKYLPGQRKHQQTLTRYLMTLIIFRVCVWSCIISQLHWHVSVCQSITQLKQQLCTYHCLSRETGSNQHI